MKNLLLAGTALAIVAAPAQAGSGMYISVFGGANWLGDTSFRSQPGGSTSLFVNSDADTGFVLGGAIGAQLTNWAKGLRAELELSYRRQDVGGTGGGQSFYFATTTGPIDANQSTFAVMANVWYDIDCGWKIKPYVGGGVGWARVHLDGAILTSSLTNTLTTFNTDNNGFAWQLGAGFNYQVQPGVDVGLGYRYFRGPENDVFFSGKFATASGKIENENHSLLVNLTVAID